MMFIVIKIEILTIYFDLKQNSSIKRKYIQQNHNITIINRIFCY